MNPASTRSPATPPTTPSSWSTRPGRIRPIRPPVFTSLVALVAGLYFVGFLIAGGLRAVYPYPIDGMEDANLQVVRQILRGQSIYAPPTLTYIPVIYPPLYFILSALAALVTGPGLI